MRIQFYATALAWPSGINKRSELMFPHGPKTQCGKIKKRTLSCLEVNEDNAGGHSIKVGMFEGWMWLLRRPGSTWRPTGASQPCNTGHAGAAKTQNCCHTEHFHNQFPLPSPHRISRVFVTGDRALAVSNWHYHTPRTTKDSVFHHSGQSFSAVLLLK